MQKHSLKGAGNGSPPTREFWKLIESGPQHAAGAEPPYCNNMCRLCFTTDDGGGKEGEGGREVFMRVLLAWS